MNLFLGANFSEFVGPNKTTIGILAKANICIIPLSIDTAIFNLDAKAVTNAGHENFEFISGKIADGTWLLIFSIKSILSFSIKKTGILFFEVTLLAKAVNLNIDQLFFLYSLPGY